MSGKGDKPRPIKDQAQFDRNWDLIFSKKTGVTSNGRNQSTQKQTGATRGIKS